MGGTESINVPQCQVIPLTDSPRVVSVLCQGIFCMGTPVWRKFSQKLGAMHLSVAQLHYYVVVQLWKKKIELKTLIKTLAPKLF